ncbi:MAG TPA: DUF6788 family protein, partial [Chloroflexota bacterium]|nr:DUF6788 family protein [Chloroflexota bacterium]
MLDQIPEGARVTYARQFRRCGKAACRRCSEGSPGHGPYWYAFWDQAGKRHSRYLGKEAPRAMVASRDEAARPMPEATPKGLRVRTLGAFQVWRDGTALPASAWRARPAATLFKILLTAKEHRVPREQILEMLWPNISPTLSRRYLYAVLHRLRRTLDPPLAAQSYVMMNREELGLR